jgi:hypothetical protein
VEWFQGQDAWEVEEMEVYVHLRFWRKQLAVSNGS